MKKNGPFAPHLELVWHPYKNTYTQTTPMLFCTSSPRRWCIVGVLADLLPISSPEAVSHFITVHFCTLRKGPGSQQTDCKRHSNDCGPVRRAAGRPPSRPTTANNHKRCAVLINDALKSSIDSNSKLEECNAHRTTSTRNL